MLQSDCLNQLNVTCEQASNVSDLATLPCTGKLVCTALQGPFTDSGYGYCAASAAPAPAPSQTATTIPSPAPGPVPALAPSSSSQQQQPVTLATLQVTPRSTVSGASCNLPMVVYGQLLADCYTNSSGSVCFPDSQTAQPCSPQAGSPATIFSLQEAGTLSQGAAGELCTLDAEPAGPALPCAAPLGCVAASWGLLLGSPFGYCTRLPALLSAQTFSVLSSLAVTPRNTVSGAACELPLVVNGTLLTDCSNGMCWSNGQQVCPFAGCPAHRFSILHSAVCPGAALLPALLHSCGAHTGIQKCADRCVVLTGALHGQERHSQQLQRERGVHDGSTSGPAG